MGRGVVDAAPMIIRQERVLEMTGEMDEVGSDLQSCKFGGMPVTGLIGRVKLMIDEKEESFDENVSLGLEAIEGEGSSVAVSIRRPGWIRSIVGETNPLMPMEESGLGRRFGVSRY